MILAKNANGKKAFKSALTKLKKIEEESEDLCSAESTNERTTLLASSAKNQFCSLINEHLFSKCSGRRAEKEIVNTI